MTSTKSPLRVAPKQRMSAGAAKALPPECPKPAAPVVIIRRYVKRIPNRVSLTSNPIWETGAYRDVPLPFVTLLKDVAIPDGEVVL